ncbi:MAG: hypothetical protein ACYDCO_03295 [Armatimonadota bacterium]
MECRILLVMLLCLLPLGALAGREVAVMVLLEGVSLPQLDRWDLPAYRRLCEIGAVGVMNNRSAGPLCFENNAATISAGVAARGALPLVVNKRGFWEISGAVAARSRGNMSARYGFNADEVFEGNPGDAADAPAAVVQRRIHILRRLNDRLGYRAIPGQLGEQVKSVASISVFGNADAGSTPARSGVVIAMDAAGRVANGDVGIRTLTTDNRRPFGTRTNYPYLRSRLAGLGGGRHFVVIEAGDGGRAESARLTEGGRDRYQRLAAEECGEFLLWLDAHLRQTTDRYLLIFAVPAQGADAAARGDLLTPLLLTGTEIAPGILTSATTHSTGVVTSTDLAPTVLAFFGLAPHPSMLGNPLRAHHSEHGFTRLRALHRHLLFVDGCRAPVLIGYALALLAGVLWALAALGLRAAAPLRAVLPLLNGLLFMPALFLVAAGLGIYRPHTSSLFFLGAAVLLGVILRRWVRDPRLALAIIGLAVAGLTCLDLLLGTPLQEKGIMSCNAVEGGRFYGLGNPMSGVLISSTLLGVFALLDYRGWARERHLLMVAACLLGVVVLIGGPHFGADFGGLLTALPAFGTAFILAHRREARGRALLWTGAAGLLLFAALIAADMLLVRSHIGLAFRHAFTHDPGVLVDAALRKWAMNWQLTTASPWPVLLVIVLLGITALVIRPVGRLREVLQAHPLLHAGFTGTAVTLILAMLTNDTGIAMAGAGLIYLLVPLILLMAQSDVWEIINRDTQEGQDL